MKRPYIGITGVQLAGKSELCKDYSAYSFSLGTHARNLPEDDVRLAKAKVFWGAGADFDKPLCEDLLVDCELPGTPWLLQDGSPKGLDYMGFLQEEFNVLGYILIGVSDAVWEERLAIRLEEGRLDATEASYRSRKQRFESRLPGMISYDGKWYSVDNSGDIVVAKRELREIINELTQGL